MKKLILGIIIILSIFMLFSCKFESTDNTDELPNDLENIVINNDTVANAEENAKAIDKDAIAVSEDMDENLNEIKPTFVLKAIVKAINSEHIEVEVIESDYAFGIYWILTSNETKYYNENGSLVGRGSIKIGDTIEITYSGQTMLSYPPQVVAYSIKRV